MTSGIHNTVETDKKCLFIYLFIYCLFNDAANTSDYNTGNYFLRTWPRDSFTDTETKNVPSYNFNRHIIKVECDKVTSVQRWMDGRRITKNWKGRGRTWWRPNSRYNTLTFFWGKKDDDDDSRFFGQRSERETFTIWNATDSTMGFDQEKMYAQLWLICISERPDHVINSRNQVWELQQNS
jgi:hypothetical protein